jgi:hypothetical protein
MFLLQKEQAISIFLPCNLRQALFVFLCLFKFEIDENVVLQKSQFILLVYALFLNWNFFWNSNKIIGIPKKYWNSKKILEFQYNNWNIL